MTARATDPTAYLESNGYTVKREGRHLSVRDVQGDEAYRITKKNDGHYVWCDRCGNAGGDNIALVQDIDPRAGYAEAVYQLAGAPAVAPRQQQQQHRDPPSLPHQQPQAIAAGRDYLKQRGISDETIQYAEKSGMVRYADGGVLFVGRDSNGAAQNVTRRAISADDPVQKRDLKGSDKKYPPVLHGKPSTVWIVEGGADALAAHEMSRRDKKDPPTVIVSGGAQVRSFLENPQVQETLKKADKVVVVGENEKDPETQAKADAGHDKQAARVREIIGRRGEVIQWTPKGSKDLAEFNLAEAKESKAQAPAREAAPVQSMADKFIAEQQAEKKQQDPDARPQFTKQRPEVLMADQRGKPLILDDGEQVYITRRAMLGTGTRAEEKRAAVIEKAQTEARLRYGIGKEQHDKDSQQQRRERERMLEKLHEKKKDKGRDDDLQL